jgi:hypothetical protein
MLHPMRSITFNTLKFAKRLEAAGLSAAQAEAEANALQDALEESGLATKQDISELRLEMRETKADIMGEMKLSRWMLTVVIGIGLTLLYKLF